MLDAADALVQNDGDDVKPDLLCDVGLADVNVRSLDEVALLGVFLTRDIWTGPFPTFLILMQALKETESFIYMVLLQLFLIPGLIMHFLMTAKQEYLNIL